MKYFFYIIIMLLLFIPYALAADEWAADYCISYKQLRELYIDARRAHNQGDSIRALKGYYVLRLLDFGKRSKQEPWPKIIRAINDNIKYHENRLYNIDRSSSNASMRERILTMPPSKE